MPPVDDKIKNRIKALLAQAESEAREQTDSGTGEKLSANTAASMLYAKKAQELLTKYHLELSQVLETERPAEYIPPTIDISTIINPLHRANARFRPRMIWFEDLAQIVAKAYFCKAGVNNEGNVFFIGLDFDREIAEMVFLNLAEVAFRLMPIEMKKAKGGIGLPKMPVFGKIKEEDLEFKVWPGDETFENSFHAGFREQLAEIYAENDQETSSIAVEQYYSENFSGDYGDYYGRDRYGNKWPEISINETAKAIGKKVARVTNKKVGATKDAALSKQEALIKQQAIARANLDGTEVIITLDNSGSMYSEILKEAINGAKEYSESALRDDKTSVGLVVFSSGADKLVNPTRDLSEIKTKADTIFGMRQGGTNMVSALEAANSMFKTKNVRRVILMVTDGMPNNTTATLNLAKNLKRQGIEIMAIGTSGCNQEFLDQLCSKKGLGLLVGQNDFGAGIKRMAGLLAS